MTSPWSKIEAGQFSVLIYLVSGVQSILICSLPVDNVLDDCFQLISLFFLTIGRNNEAPAV